MRLFAFTLAVGFTAVLATPTALDELDEAHFSAFVTRHGKSYGDDAARAKAYSCWRENAAARALHAQRNPLATFGENAFSDQCWDDFAAARLGAKPPRAARAARPLRGSQLEAAQAILRDAGGAVDWRTKGAVNPIQDQGQCGSCWAFGTVANIEGQHFLWAPKAADAAEQDQANNTLIKLSEEELVSCDDYKDSTGADQGCNGGWPDRAIKWLQSSGGNVAEKQYPYAAGTGSAPARVPLRVIRSLSAISHPEPTASARLAMTAQTSS